MNIAVVGFATEGRVSYDYFTARGHMVTICDQNESLEAVPEGAQTQLGNGYLGNLNRFDLVVRSAGINPSILLEQNPGLEPKITTAINEFLAASPTKNIIGITGTKGKGTTSTLTAKMLEAAGKHVLLGGNIGRSPLEFINELTPDSWVVLELSSFQLCDVRNSPHIAVCLMVVPEHLNWHTDMNDYINAKSQLFRWQADHDIAIFNSRNDYSKQIASNSKGHKISYLEAPGASVEGENIVIDNTTVCKVNDIKLLGRHNLENVCAAITAFWQVTQDVSAIRQVVSTFTGLPYRLEFIREVDGVKYYNDSFGTTPETAIVAIQAFAQPKVIILGGSNKGANYDELAKAITDGNVKQVIAIGEMGPIIADALRPQGYNAIVQGGKTMTEIVNQARDTAVDGDVVLLSTACASFDMFKDYKDRGNQFNEAVRAL